MGGPVGAGARRERRRHGLEVHGSYRVAPGWGRGSRATLRPAQALGGLPGPAGSALFGGSLRLSLTLKASLFSPVVAPPPHLHAEPLTQFFLALFISSTGLVLSPTFLLHHLPLLAAGATLVVISKTVLVRAAGDHSAPARLHRRAGAGAQQASPPTRRRAAYRRNSDVCPPLPALRFGCLQISAVVSAFHYPPLTALAVGLNLSQIGEFVFVLLSVANQQALLADNVYLLLMGRCLQGLAAAAGLPRCLAVAVGGRPAAA